MPCYNEEKSVPLFYAETVKQETFFHDKNVEFEFIFVDDGSKDDTVGAVKSFREKDDRVHLVSFSRTFGKEAAIIAGLEKASGDFTVLMDADCRTLPQVCRRCINILRRDMILLRPDAWRERESRRSAHSLRGVFMG